MNLPDISCVSGSFLSLIDQIRFTAEHLVFSGESRGAVL